MSSKKADIAQIRKYLQGELDARDQHELERAALDDAFLQEAMDGYAQSATDQQVHLEALDGMLDKRLNQAKVKRMSVWPYLAAACILVALTIGYLLLPGGKEAAVQVASSPKALQLNKEPVVVDTAVTASLTVNKNALAVTKKPAPIVKRQQTELRQALPAVTDTVAAPAPLPNDKKDALYELGYNAKPQTEDYKKAARYDGKANAAATMAAMLKAADTAKLNEVTVKNYVSAKKKATQAGITEKLLGKVEGVQVTTPDSRIRGVIYDEAGQPLPGVSVRVKETQQAAQTDINGRFTIAANSSKTLNIGYIGYLNKQVLANPNDSLKIALEPSHASLSEVVVVGYGKPVKQDKNPHPRSGWDNYNRYLAQQAIADEDIPKGTVKLSFTVEADGTLSNIRVVSGLNAAADKEAVDMVKNGPAWLPAANQKPKTITLKIRFKKE